MSHSVLNRPVTPDDLPQLSRLHAKAFGPGRYARSAYRVREGTPPISLHCRGAFLGERMVAAVRYTDVTVGGEPGALLLGPLAVDPEFAGQGFAKRLVRETLDDAKSKGIKLILLVGDEPYYGRLGFVRVPPGQIQLPGPVNPDRLLVAELATGAAEKFHGLVVAKRA